MSKKYSDAELTLIYHEVESKGGNAHLYRGRLWLPQDVKGRLEAEEQEARRTIWRMAAGFKIGGGFNPPEGDESDEEKERRMRFYLDPGTAAAERH